MPRSRANVYDRISHFWGKISGVTLESNPSGTTIVKSGVTATVVSATNINATKVKATQSANAGGTGYNLPYYNAGGLLLAAGKVGMTTGTTKVDASYFGMAAVYFCVATAGVTNLMNKTGTTGHMYVTTANPIPAAGVSRVYFRWLNGLGSVIAKPVSVQYFAVGI